MSSFQVDHNPIILTVSVFARPLMELFDPYVVDQG